MQEQDSGFSTGQKNSDHTRNWYGQPPMYNIQRSDYQDEKFSLDSYHLLTQKINMKLKNPVFFKSDPRCSQPALSLISAFITKLEKIGKCLGTDTRSYQLLSFRPVMQVGQCHLVSMTGAPLCLNGRLTNERKKYGCSGTGSF